MKEYIKVTTPPAAILRILRYVLRTVTVLKNELIKMDVKVNKR